MNIYVNKKDLNDLKIKTLLKIIHQIRIDLKKKNNEERFREVIVCPE